MSIKRKHLIQTCLKHAVLIILCLIIVIPFFMVFVNSFKDKLGSARMNIALPTQWIFENYAVVIEKGNLVRGFINSLTYAGVSAIVAVITCGMAAFIICRDKCRFNNIIYYFVLIGLFIPTNYVTLIRILKWLHLYDTTVGMLFVYTASIIPFCVFITRNFVTSVPVELDEAAAMDGCGPLRLYFSVIMPLMRPVLITGFLLEFMQIWSDFMTPLYLTNSQTKWPMSLAVYSFFSKNVQNWNYVFACVVLTVIPVLILYLWGQKYIIEGLTAGAVKE